MNIEKICRVNLLLLIILVISASISIAQTGSPQEKPAASLEETMRWLKEKLNGNVHDWRVSLTNRGCVVTRRSVDVSGDSSSEWIGDLTYLRKVAFGNRVILTFDGPRASYTFKRSETKTESLDYMEFDMPSNVSDKEDLAKRVANAFENLKKICSKASTEPF